MTPRPSTREDFEIAIICALPLEYDAVALLFDERWDEEGDTFGREPKDPNTYTTGRIGKHNVVLALSHMGKVNAATAAIYMQLSYRAIRLVLLVGICGGVPHNGKDEILLGDVVISKTVVQYDLGGKYPDRFLRKDTIDDNLNKHNKNLRNFLTLFRTDNGKDILQQRTAHFLGQLQANAGNHLAKYQYPGTVEDKLFESSYRHKHRISPTCICSDCHGRKDPVCDEALDSLCRDLGCDEAYLETRERLEARRQLGQEKEDKAQEPTIHIGAIASGDTVMKSGEDRDRIAKKEGVMAFEMEGAGVWEELPCLVVKGVCDYADCHKNKKWQHFAAAAAASTSKAVLERYIQTDRCRAPAVEKSQPGHFMVPFGRNESFVGRQRILSKLMEKIQPRANKDDCQRIVIEGLGGVGKTQIALEAIYRTFSEQPGCSFLWVPAVDATSFENAYRDIGRQMDIKGIDQDEADVRQLVKSALSNERSGSWLLVIDNADDVELLFGGTGLLSYLPFSRRGSILFTTRNHMVAVRLDVQDKDIVTVSEMEGDEALELLRKGLKASQTSDAESTIKLLDLLTNLPLAIKQASAYMAANQVPTSEYLELCESEHRDMIELLSKDFEDRHRYKEIQNSVATTWLISFKHISEHNLLAAEYLKFLSILADKDIPKFLLPMARKVEAVEAIGTLKAYAFIVRREGQDSFDMHRLVRLVMHNWLEEKGELKERATSAIQWLYKAFPFPEHKNRDVWIRCLPHVQAALNFQEHFMDSEIGASLSYNVAESHVLLGHYQTAEQIHGQTLELRQKLLGAEHSDTLVSMDKLANMLGNTGKHTEAEKMHRQTLELRKRILGANHLDTFTSMNNLANVLGRLGKYTVAEKMHRQTLELREKALGAENPDTLDSMLNRAHMLEGLGRYKEAESIHRQTFELRQRLLGKEHLGTLNSMNSLALVLGSVGKYEEAERMHFQTLTLYEKALGAEHPHTLAVMNNIGLIYDATGRYEEAEKLHRQTLERYKNALGEEHPDTLTSASNLTSTLGSFGKYREAEKICRHTLEIREQALGIEHPDTLASRNNLASMLKGLGKYKDAEKMHRQTLKLREKALGLENPDTLASMNNLASVLRSLGKHNEAEKIFCQTLERRENVLGREHPDTLASMNNLAGILGSLGNFEEAEKLFRQTLELRQKVLGAANPSTQISRDNLANCIAARKRRGSFSLVEK